MKKKKREGEGRRRKEEDEEGSEEARERVRGGKEGRMRWKRKTEKGGRGREGEGKRRGGGGREGAPQRRAPSIHRAEKVQPGATGCTGNRQCSDASGDLAEGSGPA